MHLSEVNTLVWNQFSKAYMQDSSGNVKALPFWNPNVGSHYATVLDINSKGVILGTDSAVNTSSPDVVLWDASGNNLALIPSYTVGKVKPVAINKSAEIVGSIQESAITPTYAFYHPGATVADPLNTSFVNLNDKIDQVSGWYLEKATSINNAGQITAVAKKDGVEKFVVLNPIPQKVRSYQVQAPVTNPDPQYVPRLGEWDPVSKTFVPVEKNSITSGDVHVLVHGWARGYLDDVRQYESSHNNQAPNVWDPTFQEIETSNNQGLFGDWTNMAEAIEYHYAHTFGHENDQVHILAFSWLDQVVGQGTGGSATNNFSFSNPDPSVVEQSQGMTEAAGIQLANALKETFSATQSLGKFQILGHSHGARVATEALIGLKNSPINVSSLVLLDSPEIGPELVGGYNGLDKLLPQIPNSTIVDNYYSAFGKFYSFDNVNNVQLLPYQTDDVAEQHSYPISWYEKALRANVLPSDLLSPVFVGDYVQDWADNSVTVNGHPSWNTARELDLLPTTRHITVIPYVSTAISTPPYLIDGVVTQYISKTGGILFDVTEHSPAYMDFTFVTNPGDVLIEFTFQFVNPGDGDQLGIWIDDNLRFLITGLSASTDSHMGVIDISDLDYGLHYLTVALHNTGEPDAEFTVSDLSIVSIPEPTSLMLWFLTPLLLCRKRIVY